MFGANAAPKRAKLSPLINRARALILGVPRLGEWCSSDLAKRVKANQQAFDELCAAFRSIDDDLDVLDRFDESPAGCALAGCDSAESVRSAIPTDIPERILVCCNRLQSFLSAQDDLWESYRAEAEREYNSAHKGHEVEREKAVKALQKAGFDTAEILNKFPPVIGLRQAVGDAANRLHHFQHLRNARPDKQTLDETYRGLKARIEGQIRALVPNT